MAADSNTYKDDLYELKDFPINSKNGKGDKSLKLKCIDKDKVNSTLNNSDKIPEKSEDTTKDDKVKLGAHFNDAVDQPGNRMHNEFGKQL